MSLLIQQRQVTTIIAASPKLVSQSTKRRRERAELAEKTIAQILGGLCAVRRGWRYCFTEIIPLVLEDAVDALPVQLLPTVERYQFDQECERVDLAAQLLDELVRGAGRSTGGQ